MIKRLLFLAVTAMLIVTCSTMKKSQKKSDTAAKGPTVSMESKQLAHSKNSDAVAEISFGKNLDVLTANARKEIEAVYRKAERNGAIQGVKIITWGDKEFPAAGSDNLTKEQQKLVEHRNDKLESYLEELDPTLDVDKFSMAEKPDLLERLFNSENAELRKSLEDMGVPDMASASRMRGKASKSIIIFVNDKG